MPMQAKCETECGTEKAKALRWSFSTLIRSLLNQSVSSAIRVFQRFLTLTETKLPSSRSVHLTQTATMFRKLSLKLKFRPSVTRFIIFTTVTMRKQIHTKQISSQQKKLSKTARLKSSLTKLRAQSLPINQRTAVSNSPTDFSARLLSAMILQMTPGDTEFLIITSISVHSPRVHLSSLKTALSVQQSNPL